MERKREGILKDGKEGIPGNDGDEPDDAFGNEGSFGSLGTGNDGDGIDNDGMGILKDGVDDEDVPAGIEIEGSFGKEGSFGSFGRAREGTGIASEGIGNLILLSVVFPLIVDFIVITRLGIAYSEGYPTERLPRTDVSVAPRISTPNHPSAWQAFYSLNVDSGVVTNPNYSSKIRKKFMCNDLHFKAPYAKEPLMVEAGNLPMQFQ
jgi:hypothetical protein